jgi:hypothetical protein
LARPHLRGRFGDAEGFEQERQVRVGQHLPLPRVRQGPRVERRPPPPPRVLATCTRFHGAIGDVVVLHAEGDVRPGGRSAAVDGLFFHRTPNAAHADTTSAPFENS